MKTRLTVENVLFLKTGSSRKVALAKTYYNFEKGMGS